MAVLPFKADDRLPPAGTILTREYKGSVVQVQVLQAGLRVRRAGVQVAQRRRQGGYRQPLQTATCSFAWASTESKHEERTNASAGRQAQGGALRRLHAQEHRGGPRTGVQHAGRAAGERRGVHFQPSSTKGWTCLPERYDDGWFHRRQHGAARPAASCSPTLRLAASGCHYVYKVDRLSRSLLELRQDAGDLRPAARCLRQRDTADQLRHVDGPPDAQRLTQLRSI